MQLTIDDSQLRHATVQLAAANEAVMGVLKKVLQQAVDEMLPEARALAPKKTGRLADALRGYVDQTGYSVMGKIKTGGVRYAHLVESGFRYSGPVGGYSRRVTQVFGRPVTATAAIQAYSRTVQFAGRPFLAPVLAEHWPQVAARLREVIIQTLQQQVAP